MITKAVQEVLDGSVSPLQEEVYRRREQMMLLTAYGSLGLIAMLFALLLSPQKDRAGRTSTPCSSGSRA